MSQEVAKLDRNMAAGQTDDGLVWHDLRALGVEGRGWTDTARYYERLPARAEALVRPEVWAIGRYSAGLAIRFESDSTRFSARWRLWPEYRVLPHFAPSGMAGLDLYARMGSGAWRWLGVGRPNDPPHAWADLTGDPVEAGCREYLLYLPLYHGLDEVRLGLSPGAAIRPVPPPPGKPIVFYGTSITHGGCASRSGMTYPAILGRRLGRVAINLGFSGNAQMEPEVAGLLAELDPGLFVLDALPNLKEPQVTERAARFIGILRAARPFTPILLVENITYQNAGLVPARRQRTAGNNTALRRTYEHLKAAGDRRLHYLPGDALLGDDGEATVDGVHPTDLGFLRIADAMEPAIRAML